MSSKYVKLFDPLDSLITDDIFLYNVSVEEDNRLKESVNLKQEVQDVGIAPIKSCSYCLTSFADTPEQRAHFKLDWHRFNLKQALLGRAAVSADDFSKLADDVSSISGSESESSEESEAENESSGEDLREENRFIAFCDAKVFWRNKAGNAFSIYKCLLLGRRELATAGALQELLLNFVKAPKKWLIVMLGGGHFAAGVFEGANLKVHKTFHCYTVRAKQGGSQASRDARGGNHPKSAGASLRRYNEMALVQHVQDIMKAWAEEIAGCSLILHRAVGPHNRSVLFGGKTPPFEKTDSRLRSIPFATRRATLKEVKRIHDVLSTLHCHGSADLLTNKLSPSEREESPISSLQRKPFAQQINDHYDVKKKRSPRNMDRGKEREPQAREIPGATNEESSSESEKEVQEVVINDVEVDFGQLKEFDCSEKHKRRKKPNKKKKEKTERQKLNDEIEDLRRRLLRVCQSGNIQELQEMISKAESGPAVGGEPLAPGASETKTLLQINHFKDCLKGVVCEDSGDTLLHVAAAKSHPAIVTELLNGGCDPTVKNRRKLTPYVVSGDKHTKTAFKDYIAEHPDKYDSQQTMIPLPLSEEQEKILNEKKREKKKKQKEREKTRKKEHFERKVDEDDKVRFLALSDREKRALAAERRLIQQVTANTSKALAPALVRCFQCGIDITGKVPFEYSTHLFCSVTCLKSHRAKTNSYGVEI